MKDLSVNKYMDIYGALLTDRQRDMLNQYYGLDYSLSEIAENFAVSRQAVHAAVTQSCEALMAYERQLQILKRMNHMADSLSVALSDLEAHKTAESAERLKRIIETVRSEYGIIQQPE